MSIIQLSDTRGADQFVGVSFWGCCHIPVSVFVASPLSMVNTIYQTFNAPT